MTESCFVCIFFLVLKIDGVLAGVFELKPNKCQYLLIFALCILYSRLKKTAKLRAAGRVTVKHEGLSGCK